MMEEMRTIGEVIAQLNILRDGIWDIAKKESAACDAASKLLYILSEMGAQTLEEAYDLLYDRRLLIKENRSLRRREMAKKAVHKNGAWHCPSCKKRTSLHHSYCHFCGQRLQWTGP